MQVNRVDLAALLQDAAAGSFPEADGTFSRAQPWRPGVEAAVALTGHAVMVVGEDVPDEALVDLGVHGLGGAHDPRVTAALAGDGEIDVLDVLLVGRGQGRPGQAQALVARPDLAGSDRVRHAARWRDEIEVFGLPDLASRGLVTLSRGIAGLTELGVQAQDGSAGALLGGALTRVEEGQILLASVTPGNARSLRFFLRHGFVPVGSVQQWQARREAPVDSRTL